MVKNAEAMPRWWEGQTGRALLASILGLEPHQFRFAVLNGSAKSTLSQEVRAAAERWLQKVETVSDATIFAIASEFTNSYAHGLASEWRTFDPLLSDNQDALMPLARHLSERPGLAWWTESVSVHQQFAYLRKGVPGAHTTAKALELANIADLDGSTWWVAPAGALVSSRGPVFGFPCVIAAAPDDHWMKDPCDSLWALKVSTEARIFEIQTKDDWSRLVGTYPREGKDFLTFDWGLPPNPETRLLLPDWRRVAQDWDGVHLSFAGYLAATYEPIPINEEHYTVLAGWHPDATSWLTSKAYSSHRIE